MCRSELRFTRVNQTVAVAGVTGYIGRHVAEWKIVDYADPNTLRGVCESADRVVSALEVTRQKACPWDIDFLGNLRLLEDAEE